MREVRAGHVLRHPVGIRGDGGLRRAGGVVAVRAGGDYKERGGDEDAHFGGCTEQRVCTKRTGGDGRRGD